MDVSRPSPAILWFRLDLRLADHPALLAACAEGGPVLPVFIWDPDAEGAWAPGRASRWWLGRSLRVLDISLRKRGSRLLFRQGVTGEVLKALARETGAGVIRCSRRYEPLVEARDAALEADLARAGLRLARHEGNLLREPERLRTGSGGPYKVFTPFWKAFQVVGEPPPPRPAPARIPVPESWPEAVDIDRAEAMVRGGAEEARERDWASHRVPGEAAGLKALDRFLAHALEDYAEARDIPADPGTSRLSPHLRFGEVTARQAWHGVKAVLREARPAPPRLRAAAATFLKELAWREFAHHVLVHFPATPDQSLRPEFAAFPWRRDDNALAAWKAGRTGYPLVDAGMRELLATGSMHNRVRMAAASFLVKDLLAPWQEGARWFWENLVDADLASNTLNWQWVAGCGADAAPYFRIFNPAAQGRRFDPHGDYVRRWVPELSAFEARWIHGPAEAPPPVLAAAGVALGVDYPEPMVDHARAREGALAAFRSLR